MKANASPYKNLTIVSTGLSGLDRVIGLGGIPTRKITELSGSWSVGKSTLALTIIAEAQKRKMPVVLADTEIGFSQDYAEVLGVDCSDLDLIQERFGEDVLDALEEWIEKHKNAVAVLDSIGGLIIRAEAEKMSGEKVIGGQAKLIATFCRKIVPLLAIKNIALIVVNHEFTDLMSGKLMTSGGAKLAYHKSLWLRLKKENKRAMKGDQQVGDVISVEVRKNKLAATLHQKTELTMIYGQGFHREADLMETAKEKLFKKEGQFFTWEGERVARGENGLRDWFKIPENAERVKAGLAS